MFAAAGESGSRLRILTPNVHRRPRDAGQSVVEFALVLPILLIIFVGIADFGRVFNAGVVIEAATRDAAEHAAQLYLADPPGNPLQTPAERLAAPVGTASSAYYEAIRQDAARVACAEMKGLTNADYAGGTCATWPVIAVCVHDQTDPNCGATASGFATVPADCGDLASGWSNASGASGERWVEVRICYRFSTILDLPIINFGDVYLQRSRSFTVACYFATGFGGCG